MTFCNCVHNDILVFNHDIGRKALSVHMSNTSSEGKFFFKFKVVETVFPFTYTY